MEWYCLITAVVVATARRTPAVPKRMNWISLDAEDILLTKVLLGDGRVRSSLRINKTL